ncbi:MAG: glycosyltransferase family 4 protein [Acidobacteriota bacterium]
MKRVHFFPKGGRWLASSRYRVFYLADALIGLGRPATIYDPPRMLRRYLTQNTGRPLSTFELLSVRLRETVRNVRALASIPAGDLIFAQRSVYSRTFAAALLARRYRRKLVFDIDDAVFEGQARLTTRMLCAAELVVVGSHELDRFAVETGARRVFLLPTSVPLEKYPLRSRLRAQPLTIGWMGTGPEHLENIRLIREPLIELAKRADFLFLFVGSLDDPALLELLRSFAGVRMEVIPRLNWSDSVDVVATLHRFDIGLMPLTDTPRHRAKCAFKAIESMACGIPVVVSSIGENKHLVDDGIDGFLAATSDEWVEKLRSLLDNDESRLAMGLRARKKIEARYDLAKNAAAFNTFLSRELG